MSGRRAPARRATASTGGSAAAVGSLVLSTATLGLSIEAGASGAFGDQTFVLSSGGPGSWSNPQYSIGYSAATGWLSFTIVNDGSYTFTPVVDASALSASTQTATVTFTDTNVSNSGQTVTITLTVVPAQKLIVLTQSTLTTSIVDETVGTTLTTIISGVGGVLATPTVGTITYSGAFTNWITGTTVTDNGDDTWTLELETTAVGGAVGGPYVATVPIVSTGATNTPLSLTASLTVTSGTQATIALGRTLDDMRATEGGSNPAAQSTTVTAANPNFPLAGPVVSAVSYSGSFTGWATAAITGNTVSVTPNITGLGAGTGFAHVDITDANASNTARYSVVLNIDQATPTPQMAVSPSAIALSSSVGSNPVPSSITVSNVSGSLADLGTVAAQFVTSVSWASLSYAAGVVTITYDSAALAAGAYSATIRVSASAAGNSPVNVPLTLTKTAVFAGSYPPGPQLSAMPGGWTYDATLGHPVGSCFNDGGYSGAADGAMPTFAGTVYSVPGSYTIVQVRSLLSNGTIVDGDVIEIAAGTELLDCQWPERPGWTEGTSGFVQVRTANHASLPAYQAIESGNFTAANRCNPTTHGAHLFTCYTATNNRSTLLMQQRACGYWFTGMNLRSDSAIKTSIVDLTAHSGTVPVRGVEADLPSHVVLDRCTITYTNGVPSGRVVSGGSRYTVVRQSWLPSIFTDDTEQQAFSFLSGCKHWDIIGCRAGGWGEHVLFGGGSPAIPNWVPRDFMFLWNYWYNDVFGNMETNPVTGLPSDDNKNAFEGKTGGRIAFFFNRIEGLNYKGDQKYAFVVKASDQAEIVNNLPTQVILTAVHCYDWIFWGNELVRNVKKGFLQVADPVSDAFSSAAIGTERVEAAWNVHKFTPSIPSKQTPSGSDYQAFAGTDGQGDGVPDWWVYHNTFDSRHTFYTPLSSGGSGWRNFYAFNNVGNVNPTFDMILGAGSSQHTAMNNHMGAGNWNLVRNAVLAGARSWNSTLSGGNYNNFMTHSGTSTAVFQDPANGDFTIINAPTASYYNGTVYAGSYQTTVGYKKSYLDEMLNGVEDN